MVVVRQVLVRTSSLVLQHYSAGPRLLHPGRRRVSCCAHAATILWPAPCAEHPRWAPAATRWPWGTRPAVALRGCSSWSRVRPARAAAQLLDMAGWPLHLVWCSTVGDDEAGLASAGSTAEAPEEQRLLQCLPPEEAAALAPPGVPGTQEPDGGGEQRRARLVARALQRCWVSAAARGLALAQQQPSTSASEATRSEEELLQPAALVFARNRHGKPFLRTPVLPSHQPARTHGAAQAQQVEERGGAPHPWDADLGRDACGGGGRAPDLQFNVSHTSGLVGCVVAPAGVAVGLDVERWGRVPRTKNVMALARRRFAPEEVAALQACGSDEERAQLFSCLWALKEAVVKARGTGISATPGSLKGFAVGVQAESATSPVGQEVLQALRRLALPAGHPGPALSEAAPEPEGGTLRAGPEVLLLSTLVWDAPGQGAGQRQDSGTPPPPPPRTCYHLILARPTPLHVAALCVALPPRLAHLWPARRAEAAARHGPAPAAAAPAPLLHLHAWRWRLGAMEAQAVPVGALGLRTRSAAAGAGDAAADGAAVRLLGCTLAP